MLRFVFALLLLCAPLAHAQAPASQDEDQQQQELERVKQQAAEKRARAQELKIREGKVLKELRATEARLRNTKTNIGALNKREQQLTRQLADVRQELDRSRSALLDQKQKLALRLRRLYMPRADTTWTNVPGPEKFLLRGVASSHASQRSEATGEANAGAARTPTSRMGRIGRIGLSGSGGDESTTSAIVRHSMCTPL